MTSTVLPGAAYREFLLSEEFRRRPDLDLEQSREVTLRWCRRLASEGFGRFGLPADLGGDPAELFLLCEALAFFDLGLMVKFGVHAGLIQATIARLGTEKHRPWLEKTPSFERIGCFAMTETAHGSDVRALETVARYEPETEEFVLHTPRPEATKDYIGSAARDGHFAVVFARLEVGSVDHGVHAFLVELRAQDGESVSGVTIEDCGLKAGLNGVDNGRISFAEVRVPRENLLDRFGGVDEEGSYQTSIESPSARFFAMLGNLLAGRLIVCGATWAGAKSALAIAIHYGGQRRQFGTNVLLDYQAHQKRLIPRLAQAYAISAALAETRTEYLECLASDQTAGRALETRIAALKAYSSWSANEAVQTCRECCGGAGYLWENRLGMIRADLDIFTTFEGDNTVLCLLVAKNLLAELKDKAPAMIAAHRAGLVAGRGSRSRALLKRSAAADLRGPEFQRVAFRARRKRLAVSLARRVAKGMVGGKTPEEAFNACQAHALALATAYAQENVYEAFARQVEEQASFAPLRDLFALWTIESEAAFYLEKGLLSGRQISQVRKTVLELCRELRDYAEELVNYFDIPDQLLGAPRLIET